MVRAIVGANWGDEGKGKITDMLAKESDIIIRFQGGSNAGHTIINNYGRFALHLLPSGVFYGHTTSIIGNGVALNPVSGKRAGKPGISGGSDATYSGIGSRTDPDAVPCSV
mgnify:CR=1 FL=1